MVLSPRIPALLAGMFATHLAAQQPFLGAGPIGVSRTEATATLWFQMFGRLGDVYVLLADPVPGPTSVFGQNLDLGLSPGLFQLSFGVFGPAGAAASIPFAPGLVPPSVTYFQLVSFDVAQGLGSLQVSRSAVVTIFDPANAVLFDFRWPPPFGQLAGDRDPSIQDRLQPLPPQRRTVCPPAALWYPFVNYSDLQPLHPAGARCQMVLRAAELGCDGHREQLTAVRWRPLFGVVAPETFPQFELHAALTDVVPDFTIDPWSALPAAPQSGLSTLFANNPRPGTAVVCYSGPYTVQPAALQPNGYLPFPAPQATFLHDGTSSLLLETRCGPTAAGAAPQNRFASTFHVLSAPEPYAMLTAVAGQQGQPSPLAPAAAATGVGGSWQWDLELEFLRTETVVETGWQQSFPGAAFDYQPAQIGSLVPPGCSLVVEYRGATLPSSAPTAWSTNQDIADGLPFLQVRVTMHGNPTTGAVPWVQSILVPCL